jgi:GNAT superfamily N-acetyltransferase
VPDAVTIRRAVPGDAAAIADLRRTVYPYLVINTAELRRDLAEPVPARKSAAWVALAGDAVVGTAKAGINNWTTDTGVGELSAAVHPDHRLRGIGTALVDAADEHLAKAGAVRVQTFAVESSAGFATKRGFEQNRSLQYVSTELRSLPPQPSTPSGIGLVPFSEVEPKLVYDADAAAIVDEPSDSAPDAIAYDDWTHEIWDAPALRHDLSVVAVDDGQVVAFTFVEADGDRVWSGMTGTLRQYRGRGLAKAVKSAALRRARDAGIVTAATSMDDRNGPMLAVNTWLGYRPVATHLGLSRTL